MKRYAVCLAMLTAIVSGCNNNRSNSPQSHADVMTMASKNEFNTSDKSIESNGNILVAFSKYKQMANTYGPKAEIKQTSEITKSPYSNLGKMVMVKGRIYKIEELPPDPNLPGRMHEVLMLADNSNSALGATTIDCLCIGDVSSIKPQHVATCGGYFVGTFDSPNAMGGTVEALAIVGNIVKE